MSFDSSYNPSVNAKVSVSGTEYTFGKPSVQWSFSYEVTGPSIPSGTIMTTPGKDEATITNLNDGSSLTAPSDNVEFGGWKVKDAQNSTASKTSVTINTNNAVLVPVWTEAEDPAFKPVAAYFGGSTAASYIYYGFEANSYSAENNSKYIKIENSNLGRTYYVYRVWLYVTASGTYTFGLDAVYFKDDSESSTNYANKTVNVFKDVDCSYSSAKITDSTEPVKTNHYYAKLCGSSTGIEFKLGHGKLDGVDTQYVSVNGVKLYKV